MFCFENMDQVGLEEVIFCNDRKTGLKAIIAIHDTTLGPAMGGTRMKAYASEAEALVEVAGLAKAMTYKASMAGLDTGGGKAVIIGDPATKNEALLRAYGRFVERLSGRYITAVDSGINEYDIDCIRRETAYALGGTAAGGRGGCPSPATAYGVWQGMKACAEAAFGSASLEGLTVAVQGLGSVGKVLCEYLSREGAILIVGDTDCEKANSLAQEWQVQCAAPKDFHKIKCDIFAPCAMGNVVTADNIHEFNCRVIAGASNNVLQNSELSVALENRGILYAPDYVINAGGLIYIAYERTPYLPEEIMGIVGRIGDRMRNILARAAEEKKTPLEVTNMLAIERIEAVRGLLTLRTVF
ncbi:MAG: Glu/Leu/Phe/Val dehydrogenase [Clostridiales bacterium]|jgi:leucine dehydrogenase|nr:Glu/Leu/Phe/Val dehydrogenase [Clostridiales bacterium]